jgi:hypothetical protein
MANCASEFPSVVRRRIVGKPKAAFFREVHMQIMNRTIVVGSVDVISGILN